MDAFQRNQCGALYDSEKDLCQLEQAAHHPVSGRRGPDETSEQEPRKPVTLVPEAK
jgi:hypothetical protein